MAKAKIANKSASETPMGKPPVAETKDVQWFKKGTDGLQEKKKQDTLMQSKKEKFATRFWLEVNPNASAKIVFVDSGGFYVWEHNLKIGGKFGNYVTCTKEFGDCPVCRTGDKSVYTAYYTIIDTREFIRKADGVKVKNKKVLFPAKGSAILMIEDIRKKNGGDLTGLGLEVKRYAKDNPNCGGSFEKLGRITNLVAKFGPESDIPIDYMKVLAPPTPEEAAALGVGATPVIGSQEDITDAVADTLFD